MFAKLYGRRLNSTCGCVFLPFYDKGVGLSFYDKIFACPVWIYCTQRSITIEYTLSPEYITPQISHLYHDTYSLISKELDSVPKYHTLEYRLDLVAQLADHLTSKPKVAGSNNSFCGEAKFSLAWCGYTERSITNIPVVF